MGLLDDYSGTSGIAGLGMSPRPAAQHQFLLLEIAFDIKIKLSKNNLFYKIATESCIDLKNLNSKAPDVVVYNTSLIPVMFIEITTSREYNKIITKAREVMNKYNVFESFIYDYEARKLTKLSGNDNHTSQLNYSDVLKIEIKFN